MGRGTHRPVWCLFLIGASVLGLAAAGCAPPGQFGLPERQSNHQKVTVTAAGDSGKSRSVQADTFMRSVALRDGPLGSLQLCPDLPKPVPDRAMRATPE